MLQNLFPTRFIIYSNKNRSPTAIARFVPARLTAARGSSLTHGVQFPGLHSLPAVCEERIWHLTADSPKPAAVAGVVRVVPELVATTQEVRVVVPAPATDVAVRSRRIITPLPDIPAHIVKPVSIGRKTTNRTGIRLTSIIISRMIATRRADVIAV